MSLHLLILHRRELTFSYEICLPASGNDQNRVLMMIPFEESTLVRCLGGCVLKSVVLQSDLKSLWHMELTIIMRRRLAAEHRARSSRTSPRRAEREPKVAPLVVYCVTLRSPLPHSSLHSVGSAGISLVYFFTEHRPEGRRSSSSCGPVYCCSSSKLAPASLLVPPPARLCTTPSATPSALPRQLVLQIRSQPPLQQCGTIAG